MIKKFKGTPFFTLLLAILLVLGGGGIYALTNLPTIELSAEEILSYANEQGISYYDAKSSDTGVIVSYYAPEIHERFFAKYDVGDNTDFIYQRLMPNRQVLAMNGEKMLIVSTNSLETAVVPFGEGLNCDSTIIVDSEEGCGFGTVKLDESLKTKPYLELAKLYNLSGRKLADNEVAISQKVADSQNLAVGDELIISAEITLKIAEVITPQFDTATYNHADFYERNVNVPFIFVNDKTETSLLTFYEENLDLKMHDGFSGNEKAYDSQNTNIETLGMYEFRLLFTNKEAAAKFVADIMEYAFSDLNDVENEASNQRDSEILAEFYNADLERAKQIEVSKEAVDEEYFIPINERLTYYELDYQAAGIGADTVCQQIDTHIISLKNTSDKAMIINQEQFKLTIRDQIYIPAYSENLPVELQPGEQKNVKFIYTFEVAGKTVEADASEEEMDEYRYLLNYTYTDSETNEVFEILVPIKGDNMVSCGGQNGQIDY
jgi:hypothetical protein